jgi:hypothetical protein
MAAAGAPARASAAVEDGEAFAGIPTPSDAPSVIGAQQYAPPIHGKWNPDPWGEDEGRK